MSRISTLLATALLFLSASFLSAQTLTLDHGEVEFYTSSILSDIEASSEDVEATIDLDSRAVEVKIPISSFEFEYEMMQDHFNEEYMESDKFPYATFIGTIDKNTSDLTTETEVGVSGNMTIHGVSKEINFIANISESGGFTKVKCKFTIIFKDYNIEEPSVLTKSVAKDVEMKSTLYFK